MSQNSYIRIYLSPPHMSGNEKAYVNDAFDSNWIAPLGPHVDAFEKSIAGFCGSIDCAALSSGTSALHLALIMTGVGNGDKVICPSLTFSASANPIIYQNAEPIFIDCEKNSWNMDPELCEKAIKDQLHNGIKPKAIIVVHLYGIPCNMDAFMRISNTYDIPIIEDAAESLGSTFQGKHTGTFSNFGVLSFNGNKIITTSGGGALLCNTPELAIHARYLATQARDKAPHYQHSVIGYNYRMSNICAAIGRGQITVLNDRINKRREIFERYYNALIHLEGISFSTEPNDAFSNRWLTTIIIDPEKVSGNREKTRLLLAEQGIESRPVWKPMHLQPVFKNTMSYLNGNSAYIFENGLCLPSGSSLTIAEQEEIIQLVLASLS